MMPIKDVVLSEEKETVRNFLKPFNLIYEDDITLSLVLEEADTLIATASASDNIIKCVAVHPDYQGAHHLNTLMSTLIKRLLQEGHDHLFVYTQPELIPVFKSLGFKEIVQTMNLTFMELFGDIKAALKQLKTDHNITDQAKGCVVINANPLTKGHLHLIRNARSFHDELIVFVVSEDRSFFPFEDRFAIITETLADEPNIHVVPTLDYLVSFATFPKYFQKHEQKIKTEHALIDVLTFKQHYMKIFNIKKRYVGKEPYSPMTDTYNATMKQYLDDKLVVIERKTLDDNPISASTVRKLLKKNGLKAIRNYVPEATYRYLQSEKGQAIIKELKAHDKRH